MQYWKFRTEWKIFCWILLKKKNWIFFLLYALVWMKLVRKASPTGGNGERRWENWCERISWNWEGVRNHQQDAPMSLLCLHHSCHNSFEGSFTHSYGGEAIFLPFLSISSYNKKQSHKTYTYPYRSKAIYVSSLLILLYQKILPR